MRIVFSLIVMSMLVFAQTINEQIHALEDASPEKRVALMNHIKEQLISMNQDERMKTIVALQEKLHVRHEENRETNIESIQSTSETQEHENNSEEEPKLENHERQEQMLTAHKADTELHQHQNAHENGSLQRHEEGR